MARTTGMASARAQRRPPGEQARPHTQARTERRRHVAEKVSAGRAAAVLGDRRKTPQDIVVRLQLWKTCPRKAARGASRVQAAKHNWAIWRSRACSAAGIRENLRRSPNSTLMRARQNTTKNFVDNTKL